MLTAEERANLRGKAARARRLTVEMIGKVGVGHVGGALSIIEILTLLYYREMRIDPEHPGWPQRDRLVISKGHAGPAQYALLAMKGYFPKSELDTLNAPETNLPSHCDMRRTVGVEMTAGSLGQGLSAAVGMALANRLDNIDARVYCIIGDGESAEGQIWEAAMYAGHKKLSSLTVILDYNKLQIDGTTDEINTLEPVEDRWKAFGFHVIRADGHDFDSLHQAIAAAAAWTGGPSIIVADTIKAKGYVGFEGQVASHNYPVSFQSVEEVLIMEGVK